MTLFPYTTLFRSLESAGQYDYILVNDVVEEAVADLETIVNAEQMKTPHMQDFLKGLCEV